MSEYAWNSDTRDILFQTNYDVHSHIKKPYESKNIRDWTEIVPGIHADIWDMLLQQVFPTICRNRTSKNERDWTQKSFRASILTYARSFFNKSSRPFAETEWVKNWTRANRNRPPACKIWSRSQQQGLKRTSLLPHSNPLIKITSSSDVLPGLAWQSPWQGKLILPISRIGFINFYLLPSTLWARTPEPTHLRELLANNAKDGSSLSWGCKIIFI